MCINLYKTYAIMVVVIYICIPLTSFIVYPKKSLFNFIKNDDALIDATIPIAIGNVKPANPGVKL